MIIYLISSLILQVYIKTKKIKGTFTGHWFVMLMPMLSYAVVITYILPYLHKRHYVYKLCWYWIHVPTILEKKYGSSANFPNIAFLLEKKCFSNYITINPPLLSVCISICISRITCLIDYFFHVYNLRTTCISCNKVFSDLLTDLPEVRALHAYGKVAVDLHQSISLLCQGHSLPQPDIEWYHEARRLVKSDQVFISTSHVTGQYSHQSVLTLSSVKVKDLGQYKCVARNELGAKAAFIQLQLRCKCCFYIFIIKNIWKNNLLL